MSLISGAQSADVAVMATRARTAWTTHLAPQVGGLAQLRKVRVAVIGPDAAGKPAVERLPSGAYYQADSLGTQAGTGGGMAAEGCYVIAHAISLQSAFPGATGRGRFYLPAPTGIVAASGQFSVAAGGTRATAARMFVQALNLDAAVIGFGQVVIASGGSVTRGLPPDLHPVAKIRVGLRPDVIRSRSNAIAEAYQEQLVTG
jgi:hypothetical protein